ncbi:amino acid ABC transporter permease [Pseudomonas graminis]
MTQTQLLNRQVVREKNEPGSQPVVPLKHHGRWVAAILIFIVAAGLAVSMVTNPRFQWSVVAKYLFDDSILSGLVATVWLTLGAMAIGMILGTLLALMRMSKNPVLNTVAFAYLWAFRGTPLLVQLIFWFNLSALYPEITLGFPIGPNLGTVDANQFITVYVAALLGLGLNEGAYMSEIVRAGLNSVPTGQREAAEALGMSSFRVMFKVILPQAMRIIIPPTGNQLIGMLKTTSLVSVIALQELLYSAQLIYTANFQTIPLLIVASLWYLLLTSVLSVLQHYVERYFARSEHRSQTVAPCIDQPDETPRSA